MQTVKKMHCFCDYLQENTENQHLRNMGHSQRLKTRHINKSKYIHLLISLLSLNKKVIVSRRSAAVPFFSKALTGLVPVIPMPTFFKFNNKKFIIDLCFLNEKIYKKKKTKTHFTKMWWTTS